VKEYSEKDKIEFIEKYLDNTENIPQGQKQMYRAFVEEGCQKEWPAALHAMAYGCYGGDDVFEEDWDKSRDCLLKLAELTDDPFCYNSLGYIFFYGRCSGEKPNYEKAFQCFSIGAAHGIYESQYKLADMFLTGKGCIKSESAGASLILSMYSENREFFCNRNYECKFADIALRVGGLFERGFGVQQDYELAYEYYLEAGCAIRKRIKAHNYYGDEKVKKVIDDSIKRVRGLLKEDFFDEERGYAYPSPIGNLLHHSVGMDITLDRGYDAYTLEAKSFSGDESSGCTLLALPNRDFCELISSVTLRLDNDAQVSKDEEIPYHAFITGIRSDDDSNISRFVYRNMVLLEVASDNYYVEDYTVVED